MLKYLIFVLTLKYISTEVYEANVMNVAEILAKKQVTLVNFYAKWCRFSQMLEPIYNELDTKIQTNELKDTIALVRIDGTVNPTLLMKYGINYFPAILLFRNGEYVKLEYHDSRDIDSLYKFVKHVSNIKPTVITNLNQMNKNNLNIYMKTPSKTIPEYILFENLTAKYIDHASFYVMLTPGITEITFLTSTPYDKVESFNVDQIASESALDLWLNRICHPIVREITFENADTIIADHKPILLLFYREHDKAQIPTYVNKLEQLKDYFVGFNMVTANAEKFKHALGHVRRTLEDAPFIAFDDFKHIYYFGKFEDLNDAEKVNKFVNEYKSGELHKRLHQEMHIEIIVVRMNNNKKSKELPNINKDVKVDNDAPPHPTHPSTDNNDAPPPTSKKPYFVKSLFQKLLPDSNSFSHVNDIHEL